MKFLSMLACVLMLTGGLTGCCCGHLFGCGYRSNGCTPGYGVSYNQPIQPAYADTASAGYATPVSYAAPTYGAPISSGGCSTCQPSF